MPVTTSNSGCRRQPGFTMSEVLVTMVILMIGLLGIAGLMAQGQRSSFEAYQRQQALALAGDMAERERALARRRLAQIKATIDDGHVRNVEVGLELFGTDEGFPVHGAAAPARRHRCPAGNHTPRGPYRSAAACCSVGRFGTMDGEGCCLAQGCLPQLDAG